MDLNCLKRSLQFIRQKDGRRRLFLLVAVLVLLAAVFLLMGVQQRRFCGIRLIEEQELLERYTVSAQPLDLRLEWNGAAAPYIEETKTYLVPEPLSEKEWNAHFTCTGGEVYALPDRHQKAKREAVAANHSFTVYLCSGGMAEERHVVFTSLPVMTMERDAPGGGWTDIRSDW